MFSNIHTCIMWKASRFCVRPLKIMKRSTLIFKSLFKNVMYSFIDPYNRNYFMFETLNSDGRWGIIYPQIPGRTALDPPNNYCVGGGGGGTPDCKVCPGPCELPLTGLTINYTSW